MNAQDILAPYKLFRSLMQGASSSDFERTDRMMGNAISEFASHALLAGQVVDLGIRRTDIFQFMSPSSDRQAYFAPLEDRDLL